MVVLTPNPSLKRSANGRPPSPVWRYAVHFRQPGLGPKPSLPQDLKSKGYPHQRGVRSCSRNAARRYYNVYGGQTKVEDVGSPAQPQRRFRSCLKGYVSVNV